MTEKEDKQKKQIIRIGIIACTLVGTGVVIGYQLGKKNAQNNSHKKWVELGHRIVENNETLGLMVPGDDGMMTYLDLKPASEDYDGMIRGFLNVYMI